MEDKKSVHVWHWFESFIVRITCVIIKFIPLEKKKKKRSHRFL